MIYDAYEFNFVFPDTEEPHKAFFDLEFQVFHGRVDVYDIELVGVEGETDPKILDTARDLFDEFVESGGADRELIEAAESWGCMDDFYGLREEDLWG